MRAITDSKCPGSAASVPQTFVALETNQFPVKNSEAAMWFMAWTWLYVTLAAAYARFTGILATEAVNTGSRLAT